MDDNTESGVFSSKYPFKYRITVTLFDKELYDVNSFVAMRAPITKTASFATITFNMPTKFFLSIQENLRVNQFIQISLQFDIVENRSTVDDPYPPKVDEIGKKQYMVLHIEALEQVVAKAPYLYAVCFLVNPVLHYLQNTNGYNAILEGGGSGSSSSSSSTASSTGNSGKDGITSYDALQKYEEWLKKTFGDQTFQFEKVGEDYKKNDFKYEQILTRSVKDLMIPTMLINHYKMWNTFGYYFFDDFRFDNKSEKDVTAWCINLGDIQKFSSKNIQDDNTRDVFVANKFIKSQAICDPFNAMWQEQPSLIGKGYNMEFGFKKTKEQRDVPQMQTETSSGSYNANRNMKIVKSSTQTTKADPTEERMIFVPDEIGAGFDRYDLMTEMLRKKILAIETYYLHDCHLDFFQFGFKYNLSPFSQEQYTYVPISICNMFIRDTGAVPMLTHNSYYQMIKFSPDDSSSSSS